MRVPVLLFLLLISIAASAQRLLDKEVVLARKEGTTGALLSELDSLPGINLSYSSGVIDLDKKVSLSGNERTVEDFLKSILKDQPLKYQESGGKIFILATEPVKKKFTLSG